MMRMGTEVFLSDMMYGSRVDSIAFIIGSRKRFHFSGARTLPWPRPQSILNSAPGPCAVRTLPTLLLSMLMSISMRAGGNL